MKPLSKLFFCDLDFSGCVGVYRGFADRMAGGNVNEPPVGRGLHPIRESHCGSPRQLNLKTVRRKGFD